tara:strand:- start:618 stop:956 length:339 start_codon:yes stop_codon:yes gene_type:complete
MIEFDHELTVGIMLHKIPVAITLASLLIKSRIKKGNATLWLALFIACTLLGSGIQHYFGGDSTDLMFMSLGLTVGILLHVSTTILFESSDHHKLSPSRITVIVFGVALGLLS